MVGDTTDLFRVSALTFLSSDLWEVNALGPELIFATTMVT